MKEIAQVSWKSPSNIAFIKYWGKHGNQLPQNPSLSMTLDKCFTETKVVLFEKKAGPGIDFDFYFEGERNEKFSLRVGEFLNKLSDKLSILDNFKMHIESSNSFPHSAGIASSASALSALALCLGSIEQRFGTKGEDNFYTWVSELARIGSGSASRSLFRGFSVWGQHESLMGTSDIYATELKIPVHKQFKCLRDVILIVDNSQKEVSSSLGHSLMNDHPYAKARFESARKNFTELIVAMRKGDFDSFAFILEHEALSLHAMMMTAKPWFTLLAPESLLIIQKIRDFRKNTQAKICFTIDAGPNIHVIFPAEEDELIRPFIENELAVHCVGNKFILDSIGNGPELLLDEFN